MIRTGICGTGDSATYLQQLFKPGSGYEITGCYDPDYAQARVIARENRYVAFRTPELLLPYVDVVYVGGGYPEGLRWCEMALRACKHVLLDEDHLIPHTELIRLKKLANEANTCLYAIEKFTSLPVIDALNTMGRHSYLMDFKCEMPMDSTLLIHLFATALRFQDGMCRNMEVRKWQNDVSASGACCGRVEFDNGSILNLLLVHSLSNPKLEIQLISANALLSADVVRGDVSVQHTGFPGVNDQRTYPEERNHRHMELARFLSALHQEPAGINALERQHLAYDCVAQWYNKTRWIQMA